MGHESSTSFSLSVSKLFSLIEKGSTIVNEKKLQIYPLSLIVDHKLYFPSRKNNDLKQTNKSIGPAFTQPLLTMSFAISFFSLLREYPGSGFLLVLLF